MDQQNSSTDRPRVIREPAIPLTQLVTFFVRSADDGDLNESTRSFAAKCAVLAHHLTVTNFRQTQILQAVTARFSKNEAVIGELTQHMAALVSNGTPDVAPQQSAGTGAAPNVPAPDASSSGDPIQDEAEALEQQEILRAEEEVARLASEPPKRSSAKPAPKAKPARSQ